MTAGLLVAPLNCDLTTSIVASPQYCWSLCAGNCARMRARFPATTLTLTPTVLQDWKTKQARRLLVAEPYGMDGGRSTEYPQWGRRGGNHGRIVTPEESKEKPMKAHDALISRAQLLKAAALSGAALASPARASALPPLEEEEASLRSRAYNGSTDPYPIPWLDKNGSHNQPAGPNVELSHIYHFKGDVARCSGFVGMGTDNGGNRIAFGSPTTDFGYMTGEYWAARKTQQGSFTHI
jgi:hypothetical protein